MKHHLSTLCKVPLLALCALSCGSDDDDGPKQLPSSTADALSNYAEIVYASYSDSLETAQALDAAIDSFVAAPSQAGLEAARDAWLEAREPYLQTEVYRFYDGPIDNPEDGPEVQAAMEYIAFRFHGPVITHIDGLAHVFWKGQMYNGRSAAVVSTSGGATWESTEVIRNGIMSKGMLLDIPRLRGKAWLDASEPVFPEDIEAAEARVAEFIGPEAQAIYLTVDKLAREHDGSDGSVYEQNLSKASEDLVKLEADLDLAKEQLKPLLTLR